MELLRAGGVIASKYRLERRLGQGGMGQVWVARHLQLDNDVALKLLVSEKSASPEARARFEREAKSAAQVKSPHIVHVFDYGLDGETPYLAMELLEGEDLEARLSRVGRLGASEAFAVLAPVCKALRRIHDAGLVHRDLKPSNVFLARHDDEDHVKILDFGIAKTTSAVWSGDVTSSGVVVGSPPYMSPEQVLASKDLDHRTDLWSAGVIAFRALSGRLPFWSEAVTQLLVEICISPVPLASRICPDLGPEVDAFFERALSRDVEERFQTAGELAAAFAELVEKSAGGARGVVSATTPRERTPGEMGGNSVPGPGPGGDATVPIGEETVPIGEETVPIDEKTVSMIDAVRAPAAEPVSPEPVSAEPVSATPVSAKPVSAIPVPAEPVPAEPVSGDLPASPRREPSLVRAVAIGAVAAGLVVWAVTAFSPSPSPSPPDPAPASSGPSARPEMASKPDLASPPGPAITSPPPAPSAPPPAVATTNRPTSRPPSPSAPGGTSPAVAAPVDSPTSSPAPAPPPVSVPDEPAASQKKREFW